MNECLLFFQRVNFESSLFFYKKIKLLNLKYLKEKRDSIVYSQIVFFKTKNKIFK